MLTVPLGALADAYLDALAHARRRPPRQRQRVRRRREPADPDQVPGDAARGGPSRPGAARRRGPGSRGGAPRPAAPLPGATATPGAGCWTRRTSGSGCSTASRRRARAAALAGARPGRAPPLDPRLLGRRSTGLHRSRRRPRRRPRSSAGRSRSTERAAIIRAALAAPPTSCSRTCCAGVRDRVVVAVTFLAMLELMKRREIVVEQAEPWGPIVARRTTPEERAAGADDAGRRGAARRAPGVLRVTDERSARSDGAVGRAAEAEPDVEPADAEPHRGPARGAAVRRRAAAVPARDRALAGVDRDDRRRPARRPRGRARGARDPARRRRANASSSPPHPRPGALIARYVGADAVRLSPAALETLAIVAYRQPVTKAAIERIRGVDSDYTVRTLLHRRLVVEHGRSEAPGPPDPVRHGLRLPGALRADEPRRAAAAGRRRRRAAGRGGGERPTGAELPDGGRPADRTRPDAGRAAPEGPRRRRRRVPPGERGADRRRPGDRRRPARPTLGERVDPAGRHRRRRPADRRRGRGTTYLALHKPAGVTSTVRDRHAARTVVDLVPPRSCRRRAPVPGRPARPGLGGPAAAHQRRRLGGAGAPPAPRRRARVRGRPRAAADPRAGDAPASGASSSRRGWRRLGRPARRDRDREPPARRRCCDPPATAGLAWYRATLAPGLEAPAAPDVRRRSGRRSSAWSASGSARSGSTTCAAARSGRSRRPRSRRPPRAGEPSGNACHGGPHDRRRGRPRVRRPADAARCRCRPATPDSPIPARRRARRPGLVGQEQRRRRRGRAARLPLLRHGPPVPRADLAGARREVAHAERPAGARRASSPTSSSCRTTPGRSPRVLRRRRGRHRRGPHARRSTQRCRPISPRCPRSAPALLERQRALAADGRDRDGRPRHRHGRPARRRPEDLPRCLGRGAGPAAGRGARPRPGRRRGRSAILADLRRRDALDAAAPSPRSEPPTTRWSSRPTATVRGDGGARRRGDPRRRGRACADATGAPARPATRWSPIATPRPIAEQRSSWLIRLIAPARRLIARRLAAGPRSRASIDAIPRERSGDPRRQPRLERRPRRRRGVAHAALGRRIHWLGKRELFDWPVIGWVAAHGGVHPVDRGAADVEAFRAGHADPRGRRGAARLPGGHPQPDRRAPGGEGRRSRCSRSAPARRSSRSASPARDRVWPKGRTLPARPAAGSRVRIGRAVPPRRRAPDGARPAGGQGPRDDARSCAGSRRCSTRASAASTPTPYARREPTVDAARLADEAPVGAPRAILGRVMGTVEEVRIAQPDRLLLRRPRGDRQGEGVGRRGQADPYPRPGRPQRGRRPRPPGAGHPDRRDARRRRPRRRGRDPRPRRPARRDGARGGEGPRGHRRHVHLGHPGAAASSRSSSRRATRSCSSARRSIPRSSACSGFAPDAIVVDEEEDWEAAIPRRKRMALHLARAPSRRGSSRSWPRSWSAARHELKIVNTVCPVTIRRQQDTLEPAQEVDLMVVVGGRIEREHQGAHAPVRDRRHARDPDRERPGPRRRRASSTGARVVGVTGGTSTPIEDLRDVAERILELAGTRPEAAARAAELAGAALTRPRRPAGRTTSLPHASAAAPAAGAA